MSTRFIGARAGFTPRNGDKYYFYEPSTTTAKDVFSNAALTTPITQPVVADSVGLLTAVYMSPELYRVIIKRSNDTQVSDDNTFDPGVPAGTDSDGSVLPITLGGTGSTTAAGARAALGAAASSTVTTLTADVSDHDTLIATGLFDATRFGNLASEDLVTTALMTDQIAFLARNRNTTVLDTSVTATTPARDNTTPLVSEGDEVFSTAYTPVSATSFLKIHAALRGTGSTTINVSAHIFNGSTCLVSASNVSAGDYGQVDAITELSPGATTPITISVRSGVNTGTFTVNGSILNSTMISFLLIEEWETIS